MLTLTFSVTKLRADLLEYRSERLVSLNVLLLEQFFFVIRRFAVHRLFDVERLQLWRSGTRVQRLFRFRRLARWTTFLRLMKPDKLINSFI